MRKVWIKKLGALAVAIILCVGLLPTTAFAAGAIGFYGYGGGSYEFLQYNGYGLLAFHGRSGQKLDAIDVWIG